MGRVRLPACAQKALEEVPSGATIQTLANLAMVLGVVGRFREGIEALNEAVAALVSHHPGNVAALYSARNNLAGLYHGQKENARAEAAYLELLREAGDPPDPAIRRSVAATHDSLGVLYAEGKAFDQGERHLLSALAMRRELFGERSSEVGCTLYNLAGLYYQRGDTERAASVRAEALGILGRDPLEGRTAPPDESS